MIHFRDRYDVIEWVIANCGQKPVLRVLETGGIEFLGAFEHLPPYDLADLTGWIVTATSKYGKKHIIAVVPKLNTVRGILLQRVPWENYKGGKTELYAGDHPDKYKLRRKEENEKRKDTREGYAEEG